jgi:transcriptional regulator with XRE-family HTH domain
MRKPSPFAAALTAARQAAGVTQTQIARELELYPNQVHRWEKQGTFPSMEKRIAVLRMLKGAPRALLDELARQSDVTLESIGMGLPPPPPPSPPAHAAAASPATAPPMAANAQATIDDAVREAAEEMDVSPKVLRPALSRMLDRLARTGVPIDAAARMVLGVPKKASPK